MKKRLLIIIISSIFILSLCAFYAGTAAKSNSKIIAKVGDYIITQNDLNAQRKDSCYDQIGKTFSDKEVLDDIVNDKLLLIKAKQLNINFSDQEIKKLYKGMLMAKNSQPSYTEGDENNISKKELHYLRDFFQIQKVKQILGTDVDKTLNELRNNTTIVYYN